MENMRHQFELEVQDRENRLKITQDQAISHMR